MLLVTCPACGKRTQVQLESGSTRARCPRSSCRRWFQVGDNGETFLPRDQAESVDDVEIVEEVEAVAEPELVESIEAIAEPDIVEAVEVDEGNIDELVQSVEQSIDEPVEAELIDEPPPRRPPKRSTPPSPPLTKGGTGGVRPPPVRRPPTGGPPSRSAPEVGVPSIPEPYAVVSPAGRLARRIVLGSIAVAIVGSVVAGLVVWNNWRREESNLKAQALQDYQDGNFALASRRAREVLERYPRSGDASLFQFLADWSDLRTTIAEREIAKAQGRLPEFLKEYRQTSHFKEYRKDVWQGVVALAESAAAEAERAAGSADTEPDVKQGTQLLQQAQAAFKVAQDIGGALADDVPVDQRHAQLQAKIQQSEKGLGTAQARKELLEHWAGLLKSQRPGAVEEAFQRYEAAVTQHAKLADDAKIKSTLDEFKQKETSWVKYTAKPDALKPGTPSQTAMGKSVVVCPLVTGNPGSTPPDDGVVLALARGVLYGLSQATGEARWAVRLGIDSPHFPLRLGTELVVAWSSETQTLLGLEAKTGRGLWQFPAGAASPAGPTAAGRRVYLPLVDGRVCELDASQRRFLGHYDFGQPITVPATFHSANGRLYVPADRRRIYVIDTPKRQCAGVIYSEHAANSLRAGPFVIGSTLLLTEAAGLQSQKIRTFTIPVSVGDTQPADEYEVPGWSSFGPYFDGDTMAVVADRGALALFGVGRGTRDKPIFPLATPQRVVGDDSAGSHAQIVAADLNHWWVLAGGSLQRHRFDLYRQQLVPASSERLVLGSPLHEPQRAGGRVFLVTQDTRQPRCLATAIDSATGAIIWQRQLGLLSHQPPVVLGPKAFALDAGGALIQFDANGLSATKADAINVAGELAASGSNTAGDSFLLKSAAEEVGVALLHAPATQQLIIRKCSAAKGLLGEQTYRLESGFAGMPVVGNESLFVPARDGNLYEFPLESGRSAPPPVPWRDRGVDAKSPGHAALLSNDLLVVSDGAQRLLRWERGGDKTWRRSVLAAVEVPAPIATPIFVLRSSAKADETFFVVGDTGGTLHLLSAKQFSVVRQWPLGGRITAGPFLRGSRIGCVVDETRLIWLDPGQDSKLWEYQSEKGRIIGEPQQLGGLVLVTEQSGALVWGDATNGTIRHRQQIPFKAPPTTNAIVLGDSRALVPLSDGTLFHASPEP